VTRDGTVCAHEPACMSHPTLEQPSNPLVDVALRDGRTVCLRPVRRSDVVALAAFFAHVSPDSVRSRFFGARHIATSECEHLAACDGDQEYVVVAELDGVVVAVAQYVPMETPDRVEVAFLVADSLQGFGIGTRLLDALVERGRTRGVAAFHAWVLPENRRMLDVFAESGFAMKSTTAQGVIEVVLSLAPAARREAKAAARASMAARASLRPFFEPRAVAVVGASRTRGGVGAEILNNLRTTGFGGPIVPIHPSAAEIQGLAAYRCLADVPHDIDLAVIVVPAAQVLPAARDAAAKHVRALVVISAGFSEVGDTGRAQEAELLDVVRNAGMRMIGPNCMGLLNADPGVLLNATFSPVFPPAGRVAFSTQSGALGLAILEYARRVNLGMSTFASIGNKADVSSNDLLQYWADDPKTAVILLYLESFGNPRKFAQLAREIGRRKPIVAVKAGRSSAGARAASSHTGALAASDTIVDALFRHAGVIRTTTLEEMFDVAMLLDRQPLPQGGRVAILTNAGGPGILAADACEGHGLQVAALEAQTIDQLRAFLPATAGLHNPVDMIATASAEDYGRAMRILLADRHVDSLLTIFIPPLVTAASDVAGAMTEVARTATKPVLATFMSVDGAIPMLAPIPCYRFPEAAVSALAKATAYGHWRQQDGGTLPALDGPLAQAREVIRQSLAAGEGWMAPVDAQRVLEAVGIPHVATRAARSLDEVLGAARDLGYPVALKGLGASLLHKTEADAVRLGLRNDAEVRAAFDDLSTRLAERLTGVLVQRMAGEGVEMFIGGLQDPQFGPVVFCGSGGVLVELFGDAVCRLCPVSDAEAGRMLDEIRGVARLRGHRGRPPADEASLRAAVARVSALLDACPEIQEMDLNPVLVGTTGICAVDVRIRVASPAPPRRSRRVQY
jgi:acetate---CoA ligase (ADP-forming)